jgi:hypothetical protein
VFSIRWARLAKRRFVSYTRGFGLFKPGEEAFFVLSLLHFFLSLCSAVFVLAPLSFSGESFSFSFFLRFVVFFATLDHSLRNFFLGVCRTVESEGRPISFGDLIPSSCVLHRLSEEFFELVSPALNTWREVRALMASERGSWSSVRSEDLPEGLSDRDEGTRSLEETPSISGSSEDVGPEASWRARSYLSKVVDVDEIDRYRRRYQIPEDVVLRIPESDEVACSSRYGDVAFYEADFNAGVRFPLQPLMRELLDHLNLSPGQLAPNAWRTVVGCMVMWKVLSDGKDDLTLDELLFCYKPSQIAASPGFWSLNMRQRGLKLVVGTPSSNREWKDRFVFVCGDNWEGLLCEKDDDFIRVRRKWGVPSSSGVCVSLYELSFCGVFWWFISDVFFFLFGSS